MQKHVLGNCEVETAGRQKVGFMLMVPLVVEKVEVNPDPPLQQERTDLF
jgi:hypothetical protein